MIFKSTDSNKILENDFKDFPPKPLKSPIPKPISVKIKKYNKYIQFKKFIKIINVTFNSKINKSEIEFLQDTLNNDYDIHLLRSDIDKIPDSKLAFILLKVLSPLLALGLCIRARNRNRLTLGLVDCFHKNTIFYTKKPYEEIISHENIHILQHRNFYDIYNLLNFNPNKIIDEHHDDSGTYTSKMKQHLKYLCGQCELEARLHELVVSVYRRDGILPQGTQGFVKIIKAILNQERVTRNSHVDDDLFQISTFFSDIDRLDFFFYVLIPLLYSNLLLYYGDFISSYKIKRNIINRSAYTKENGFHFK